MPPEIRLLILETSPDIPTLLKACHAGTCLWSLYAKNKPLVIERVLRNEISPTVFPLAIAVDYNLREEYEITGLKDSLMPEFLNFAEEYFICSAKCEGEPFDAPPDSEWHVYGMKMAIRTSQFHALTVRLAKLCASELHKQSANSPLRTSLRITATEIERYQKAIYIVEIIGDAREAFEDDEESMYRDLWLPLWDYFEPWESLQVKAVLYCLADLLRRTIAENSYAGLSNEAFSLVNHILFDEQLPRTGPKLLMDEENWTCRRDGLAVLLQDVCLEGLDMFFRGKTPLKEVMDGLLFGLSDCFEDVRSRQSFYWNNTPYGPWIGHSFDWDEFFSDDGPISASEKLDDIVSTTDEPELRDLWLWLCIVALHPIPLGHSQME